MVGSITGTGARVIRQDLESGETQALLWSPNHSSMLEILAPGRLVFDARSTRENLQELSVPAGAAHWLTRGNSSDRQPAYSPDGDWVVFSSNGSGNLDLWAVSTRSRGVRRLTDDQAEDWDPAYTPDGQHLLWSSNRSGHFEVWMAAPDGSGRARSRRTA